MEKKSEKFQIVVLNDNTIQFCEYYSDSDLMKEQVYKAKNSEEKEQIILKIFAENYKRFFNFEKNYNLLSFHSSED